MWITVTAIIIIVILVLILAIGIARLRRKRQRPAVEAGTTEEAANKQVYVGNLSYQVTEQDLKNYFNKYGTIDQVRIVRHYNTGRSKGFGFVTYHTVPEAKKALAAHGQKYKDRTIVVRIAKPR